MVAVAYIEPMTPVRNATNSVASLYRRDAVSDPLVDTAARLLSYPLHQLYALLWRVGLLTIDE